MYITWKDPNMKLHGKQHKRDCFYFRWHYGKQRIVQYTHEYIDRPTEKQKASRQTFTTLRKEVARQLHDPILHARWEARFKQDKEGYKMLHTYVYAKLKAGETVIQSPTCRDTIYRVSYVPLVETSALRPLLRGNEHPHVETPISGCTPRAVSTSKASPKQETQYITSLLVVNGVIIPLSLPRKVPKRKCLRL